MNVKVARWLILVILAGIVISATTSCATRPRKCDGRRGVMTPMGVM